MSRGRHGFRQRIFTDFTKYKNFQPCFPTQYNLEVVPVICSAYLLKYKLQLQYQHETLSSQETFLITSRSGYSEHDV
ncbi:hypothetical protein MPLSOD_40230 [Mesorhizobium sp. SOD10]|nr:hypothetical protein MPLSOD_40230 [Mesorhizobium sp. SOD10]